MVRISASSILPNWLEWLMLNKVSISVTNLLLIENLLLTFELSNKRKEVINYIRKINNLAIRRKNNYLLDSYEKVTNLIITSFEDNFGLCPNLILFNSSFLRL